MTLKNYLLVFKKTFVFIIVVLFKDYINDQSIPLSKSKCIFIKFNMIELENVIRLPICVRNDKQKQI